MNTRHLLAGRIPYLIFVVVVLLGAFGVLQRFYGSTNSSARPNIVIVMSDDQRFDSMDAMPITKERLGGQGVTYTNAFIPTPLCCPSRVSFLTGKYAHNTGIWRNNPPEGGFESFSDDTETVAVLLKRAGYRTALVGKYMNGYHQSTYVPPGWDEWYALNKGNYYNYSMNENGENVRYGTDAEDYSGTVIEKKAVAFIGKAKDEEKPFFLVVTPNNPHGDSGRNIDEVAGARPAPEDEESCIPQAPYRPPNFNEEDVSDKPSFIRQQKLLTKQQIAEIDSFHTRQHCALRSLDRMIGRLLDALGEERENTMFVFYSDNGYAYGEHRNKAKNCLYEECVRVPMIISYPTLTPNATVSHTLTAANIDVTATVLAAAGVKVGKTLNGVSLLPTLRNPTVSIRDDVLLEVHHNKSDAKNYAVRTKQFKYIENGTGEKELYDVIQDPFELINVVNDRAYAETVATLSKRLATLKRE